MACQKHKRYKAARKPRTGCTGCWWFYLYHHDSDEFSADDMHAILAAAEDEANCQHTKVARAVAGALRIAEGK